MKVGKLSVVKLAKAAINGAPHQLQVALLVYIPRLRSWEVKLPELLEILDIVEFRYGERGMSEIFLPNIPR